METINIALSFDNKYAQHAAVTITSVLENNTSKRKYHFFLFSPDLSNEHRSRLTQLINSYRQNYTILEIKSLHYVSFNDAIIKKYHYMDSNVTALFFKILFQDNLPDDVNKILYLDSDMVALSDLGELFDIQLQNYVLGAVCEDITKNHLKEIGFKAKDDYFNSGLMLLDIKKWKELSIGDILINEAKSQDHLYSLHDQDVLNVHFKNNFLHLDQKYNQMVYLFNSPPLISKVKSKYKNIDGICKKGIMHYTGIKPWRYECLHPYKDLYFKYLEKTEFRDFKIPVETSKRNLAYINAFYLSRKIYKTLNKIIKLFR